MKNIIKLIITIAIFYYLFQHIDFDTLWQRLSNSHGGWIFVALLMQLTSTYLAAYRWFKISQLLVFKEKLSFYVQSYFKGTFFNQVLPSSIGGDAVRIIDLTRENYDKKDAFYGVFVDRVVGLVGLLVLNLIASILFYGTFEQEFSQLIIFIALSGIIGFASLFHFHRLKFLEKYKFLNLFNRLAKRLNTLYASRMLLIKHISISVIVHLFSVLTMYGLSLSLGLDLSFQTLLIAVPPVFLLTIVPLSLAGWGIREGAMIGVFMLVGADQTKVLAMSILYGLLLIISALPGSYFWIKSKKAT
ncbi:flippase-like domain-containing protein [Sulfurimonas aquatica]|uniref:Flippase-like domain-containing protein n=1 Tax=Sulfurimonas aquatica TaxID=2672570 RepID=A0A975GCV7_9BACT|nr:lysylphosphatidylglycerol synthase transmembrane domain-containing protein [Sulfurimonas aquatica]QSZ41679.1 flippase-like domain-containing protein [Sulfurimonas aquatica]